MKLFSGYSKQNITDTSVLLAGGGSKPITEFKIGDYLPLSGGTMTGSLLFGQHGTDTYTFGGIWVRKNVGLEVETPRATNSASANIYPFYIKTRGGLYAPLYAANIYSNDTKVSVEGHKHPYTDITGSSTTADMALVSTTTANTLVFKQLGSRAFDSTSYLPLTGGTVTGALTVNGSLATKNFFYLNRATSTDAETGVVTSDQRIYTLNGKGSNAICSRFVSTYNPSNGVEVYYSYFYGGGKVSLVTSGVDTQSFQSLELGNGGKRSATYGVAGNILLYGQQDAGNSSTVRYGQIRPDVLTANRTYTLPDATGIVALTTSNVASATKLQTARTLTIGNADKTFDGTANVTWTLSEIGAAAADHSHSYLPITGGTVTGPIEISTGTKNNSYNEGLRITKANNNWAGITFGSTGLSGAPTDGWFAALNPSGQFIISPDTSANTTGLTLTKGGDLKWRNTVVSLNGHKHAYTDLTGSSTTVDQVICSSGTANGWVLKTLGSNAFSSIDYVAKIKGTGSVVAYNLSCTNWDGIKLIIPGGYAAWMMAFTLRIYNGYEYTDIVCSGYHYGSNHWHSPAAQIIGGTRKYKVIFGYTGGNTNATNNLYVWVGNANNSKLSHGGIAVMNLMAGHSANIDFYTGWTIENVAYSNLTNIQAEQTPELPSLDGHSHTWDSITSKPSAIGSTTLPIYWDGSTFVTGSYELKSTVNAGTANRLAWYSDTDAISSGSITTDGSYLGSVSYLSINDAHQTSYKLYIKENRNAWATRTLEILAPNLTSGSAPFITIGKADSNKNMGWIAYVHSADGSTSNRLSFGLHSVDNILNIVGTGNVGIGVNSPSYKLHVSGTLGVTGAATLSSSLSVAGSETLSGYMYLYKDVTVNSDSSVKTSDQRIYVKVPTDGTDTGTYALRFIVQYNKTNPTSPYTTYTTYFFTGLGSISFNTAAAGAQSYQTLVLGNGTKRNHDTAPAYAGRISLYQPQDAGASATVRAGTIQTAVLTAARTYTLPDATGTVALTNQTLLLTGGTLTGQLTISKTTDLSTPALYVNSTNDYNGVSNMAAFTSSTLTANHMVGVFIGKACSNYNSGLLRYDHKADSSDTNVFNIGVYGVPDIITVNGKREIGINGTATSAYTYTSSKSPGFANDVSSGWAYIRIKSSTDTEWHVGSSNSATFAGGSGAFEIRDAKSSYSGISIRRNTSSYGKLVVTAKSGECSIGLRTGTSGNPQWVFGIIDATNYQFGLWNTSLSKWKANFCLNGNLYLGDGTTQASYRLHVNGDTASTNFYTTSDRSKKTNITLVSDHILKFTLKETNKDAYGVIAQDVPEIFREGEEGNMTVNYNSILSYYIALLENRCSKLENELKELKERLWQI